MNEKLILDSNEKSLNYVAFEILNQTPRFELTFWENVLKVVDEGESLLILRKIRYLSWHYRKEHDDQNIKYLSFGQSELSCPFAHHHADRLYVVLQLQKDMGQITTKVQ